MALDIPSASIPVATSRVSEALAFDDVLVVPAYSQIIPAITGMFKLMVRVSRVRVSVCAGIICE